MNLHQYPIFAIAAVCVIILCIAFIYSTLLRLSILERKTDAPEQQPNVCPKAARVWISQKNTHVIVEDRDVTVSIEAKLVLDARNKCSHCGSTNAKVESTEKK